MSVPSNRHYLPIILAGFCAAFPIISSAEFAVEEVIVTGTKRQMTLQDVPIAVSVTSNDTIEKAAIQDINDLQSVVPTLRVTQLQSANNTNFAIRGFGNGTNNEGIESSVGIFIDGVYRSRAGAAIADLPRRERVEVLSGPQSTLFGKNASAGVISIITPTPTGETAGYIGADISNFNGYRIRGLYESAISEDLTFDVSGTWNQRDGYFENSFPGSTDLNEKDRWVVRGQIHYTPTESTSIRVIADHDEIDEVCCGTSNLASGITQAAIESVGGQLVPNEPFSRDSFLDIEAFNEIENGGISLHVDVDYDAFTLTSITSFRTSDVSKDVDIDYTSASLISNGTQKLGLETFTQEFRLTSSGDAAVDWMIGTFYFDEDLDFDSTVLWGEDSRAYFDQFAAILGTDPVTGVSAAPVGTFAAIEGLFMLPVGTFWAPDTGVSETVTQDDQAVSFFGTVDWHINDALTATVGLNYTKDEKEVSLVQDHTHVYSQLPSAPLGALAALQTLVPTLEFPNSVEDGKSDDSDTTYTVRLAWNINDTVNVYASSSTGFKASSWNLSRDSAPFEEDIAALTAAGETACCINLASGTRLAGPEEATVYEFGLKAKFERGSFTMAIFDQTIEGFQSSIFTGNGFVLANAGEQSTEGVEFDLTYYPLDELKLTLSGIFLDPIYDSFVGGNDENGPIDLSGTKPAGIHEVSISTSATYSFQLAGNDAYVRGDFQYEDEVRVVENVAEALASREVKLLNLSAGISLPGDIDVSLWVRNVTDEDYLLSAFPTPAQGVPGVPSLSSFNGYPNQPRTYGLGVKKTF